MTPHGHFSKIKPESMLEKSTTLPKIKNIARLKPKIEQRIYKKNVIFLQLNFKIEFLCVNLPTIMCNH